MQRCSLRPYVNRLRRPLISGLHVQTRLTQTHTYHPRISTPHRNFPPTLASTGFLARPVSEIPFGPFNLAHKADSPWAAHARHLLRALLRECTYLPDAYAREYLKTYILSRFRRYVAHSWTRRDESDFELRFRDKHREARKAIDQLRRANEGERLVLLKVLMLTYGRAGKRRADLLQPLLQREVCQQSTSPVGHEMRDDGNLGGARAWDREQDKIRNLELKRLFKQNTSAGECEQAKINTQRAKDKLSPALYALITSQASSNLEDSTRAPLRRTKPDVPILNTWNRPTPQCRVRNIVDRWYQGVRDQVQAPLPAEEWHRLRDLALGIENVDVLVPRRKCPATPADSMLELAMTGKRLHSTTFGNRRAVNITRRSMRRLWAKVFRLCPMMEWDPQKNKWDFQWGNVALKSSPLTSDRTFAKQVTVK